MLENAKTSLIDAGEYNEAAKTCQRNCANYGKTIHNMNKTILIGGGAILVAAIAAFWWMIAPPDRATPDVNTAMHGADSAAPAPEADSVIVPQLSQIAQNGKTAFTASCAACHGTNAAGTDQGPPLVHKIYEPSHHADFAFVMAVRNGVRSHHWRFGDMPPAGPMTDAEINSIITYVREIQAANGIN